MASRGKLIWPLAAAAVITAGGGTYALLNGATAQENSSVQANEPAVKVALAKAEPSPYTYYLESIGKIESRQQTSLSAETSGRVVAVNFDSGKVAKTGEVLVRLNDEPEQADLIRLRGALDTAKAQFERLRELQRTGAESQRGYDDARAKYDAARGELQRVQANIDQKVIRVPFEGELGIRKVHLGQYLQAGNPIVTLTNLKNLRANFTVPEQDASKLSKGQPVLVTVDSYPDRTFEGKINAIDPQFDSSHIINAQAEINNTDGLLNPGMYARVRVAAETRQELIIPESAITYNAYGETVFVTYKDEQGATRVRRANVKVGERREGYAVVTGGLKPGTEVVTSGQIKLADGILIQRGNDTIALSKNLGGIR